MVLFVPTAQARLIRRMEGSLEDWLENLWAFQQVSHRWQCKRAHVNTLLCASKCTSDESVCEGVKSTMNASYIARWTIVFFNQTFLSLVSRSFQTRFFVFVEIHRKFSYTSGECVRLSGIKTENYRIVLKHSLHLLHQKPGIAADSRSTYFLRISPRNVRRKIYKYVFLHKKRGKKVTGSNRKDTYQIKSLFFSSLI